MLSFLKKVIPQKPHVKVIFETENGSESLWAKKLKNNIFELDNSPFDLYGFSYKDKVKAANISDGIYRFTELYKRGGHSTYRVKLAVEASHEDFLNIWPELKVLGCSYESTDGLYSIDFTSIDAVHKGYSVLENYEQSGIWHFEEAHYAGR